MDNRTDVFNIFGVQNDKANNVTVYMHVIFINTPFVVYLRDHIRLQKNISGDTVSNLVSLSTAHVALDVSVRNMFH